MVVIAVGRRLGERFSVRLAGGAILSGTMMVNDEQHDVEMGWLVSVAGSGRTTFGPDERLFITGTISLGVSRASTSIAGMDTVGLTASDLRVSGLFGTTLWNRFSPYVLARAFGGPVFWRYGGDDITGTDQHHYQLGVGANVLLPSGFSALADLSVLGERSLSIGVSYSL